ncbi:MAG: aminoacyl-tRNA hydrolase, partial [Acetobacteraceae bacterium]
MQLWVGLGNPEPAMARQRHNVGFMAIEVIATALRWPAWRARFKGRITEGGVGQARILA